MFFPEELKPLIADVTASKSTYNNPGQMDRRIPVRTDVPGKNTLLVLYDIPGGTMTEHIDGFFPEEPRGAYRRSVGLDPLQGGRHVRRLVSPGRGGVDGGA